MRVPLPERYQAICRYHDETKHHPERYARSLGYMDWANQPDPFRRYGDVPQISLPFLRRDPEGDHIALYDPGHSAPRPFEMVNIAGFLELSLGLSAWKSAGGGRWALRMNPSSGNLHPTECHLILPELDQHPPCVAHYEVFRHALAVRARLPNDLWKETERHFGGPGFGVVLTSIFWREAWKYGERALRYTQHDIGHALAALRIAANLFGWRTTCLDDAPDEQIVSLLGLDSVSWPSGENERVASAVWVYGPSSESVPRWIDATLAETYTELPFEGSPNVLSAETMRWALIDDTADRLEKPATQERWTPEGLPALRVMPTVAHSAASIIRRRRSAQHFDAGGALSKDALFSMLDKTRPRSTAAPFDLGIGPPRVDLLLFVHRVTGLPSGMYLFSRCDAEGALREQMSDRFDWTPADESMPLFLLKAGDYRDIATVLSCHQDIAGDSALSLGMLARFDETLRETPWRYRHLFWETGMIGQVLYLEAEAHGVRGTGIGCFFDDVVHELLGLNCRAYQSLYHFTIGEPIDDPRLTTLPAYHHLER